MTTNSEDMLSLFEKFQKYVEEEQARREVNFILQGNSRYPLFCNLGFRKEVFELFLDNTRISS